MGQSHFSDDSCDRLIEDKYKIVAICGNDRNISRLKVMDTTNLGRIISLCYTKNKNTIINPVILQLDHKNIVKYHGKYSSAQHPVTLKKNKKITYHTILLEYWTADLSYLIQCLNKNSEYLPVATIQKFALSISRALAYLHDNDVFLDKLYTKNIVLVATESDTDEPDIRDSVASYDCKINLFYIVGDAGDITSRQRANDIHSIGMLVLQMVTTLNDLEFFKEFGSLGAADIISKVEKNNYDFSSIIISCLNPIIVERPSARNLAYSFFNYK